MPRDHRNATHPTPAHPSPARPSHTRPSHTRPWTRRVAPLVISAPFGNYIRPAGATPTLGTFTALRRRGRLWRIIKTVRYHAGIRAWTNKIGLRNPGIDWLIHQARAGRARVDSAIVSIHGFNDAEWEELLEKAQAIAPLAIELNMSCPNVGHVNWPSWLFDRAARIQSETHELAHGPPPAPPNTPPVIAPTRTGIIVKLPPVNYQDMAEAALHAGLRAFHCCNTLPVPVGGMSGKPLMPVSLQCIADLRRRAAAHADDTLRDLFIIGGGGITTPDDIDQYARVGANRFAIGTKAFDPRLLLGDAPVRALIEHAAAVVHAAEPDNIQPDNTQPDNTGHDPTPPLRPAPEPRP